MYHIGHFENSTFPLLHPFPSAFSLTAVSYHLAPSVSILLFLFLPLSPFQGHIASSPYPPAESQNTEARQATERKELKPRYKGLLGPVAK